MQTETDREREKERERKRKKGRQGGDRQARDVASTICVVRGVDH